MHLAERPARRRTQWPNGTAMNVFYVGANGQIYNWYWNGSTWSNGQL